ncbi:tyrosine-type recombinase/integrase [Streptomyces hirsutus]|uniref:hypothetical protein n=1 Tax=Streptomyces hirsutus TaxID=35620 RepID=UPI0036995998
MRRKFAPSATLTGDDEYRDPLDQGVRQVECGRVGNQQGSSADGLRLRTPPSTARGSCPLRPLLSRRLRHPIGGRAENVHWAPGRGGAPKTQQNQERKARLHIVPHLGHLPLRSITAAELRAYTAKLEATVSSVDYRRGILS